MLAPAAGDRAEKSPAATDSGGRPRVAVLTLGCKVNQAEGDALADGFLDAGFDVTSFESQADIYVVNTCSVTHVGDAKSRQVIRQAQRRNPDALVVATGCFATVTAHRFPIDDVVVVKNRDKDRLVEIVKLHITSSAGSHELVYGSGSPGFGPAAEKPIVQGAIPSAGRRRTRSVVKVQDGCDSACSYCIIPRARGRSRSIAPADCVSRVNDLVAQGHPEIVITGVDLGSYGDDSDDFPDLGGLLQMLLEQTSAHRIRISSVEPGDFNVQWLRLWTDLRLCNHLHVPLQAGSDSVLVRMRRKYDTAEFRSMIDACREQVPDIAITTDLITGFPGETAQEFQDGLDFTDRCRFDGMHVFPYSRRSGTAAGAMADSVPEPVKMERASILRERADRGRTAHIRRHLGSVQEVVWENNRDGIWRGMSANNIRVFTADASLTAGQIRRTRLTAAYAEGAWGEDVDVRAPIELSLVATAP